MGLTRQLVLLFAAVASFGADARAQELQAEHRVALNEAFRLIDHVEGRWPGWDSAPEAVLIVDGEAEFLIGHPRPTEDFAAAGPPISGRAVFVRDRQSPQGLLATYPAVGGIPTIVVGTPESTGLGPTQWILTVVHEHFHQLQMSRPNYYNEVEALELSGADDDGMWMLNYPFPYSDVGTGALVGRLGEAARALATGVRLERGAEVSVDGFLAAREDLAGSLAVKDHRYLAFQLWQEGVARYAELDAAEYAAGSFPLSAAFAALPGAISLEEAASDLWSAINSGVDADLAEVGRVYFYSLGALEAVLLEAARPGWRPRYTQHLFDTRPLWGSAR